MANSSEHSGKPERGPDSGPFETLVRSGITENSIRLIWTRWVAGVLVLLATAFCAHVLRLPLPEWHLYATGAAILAYNAPLTWLMQRAKTLPGVQRQEQVGRIVRLQVLLDWVSMSVFVHLTGGITSPAIPFFLIHMLMVTILLPGQSPYLYVALGIGAIGGVAIMEQTGVLPHYTVIPAMPPLIHSNLIYIGAQMAFISIVAFAVIYLTANIMRQLRERERQITTLLQTIQTVSSTLSLQEVMERLARSAAAALSMPAASIRLLGENGERLEMTAAYGLSQGYLAKGPVELSRNQVAQEALMGRWVIVNETINDPRLQYPQQVLEEGIRSMLAVPIIGRGGSMGVLRVYARHPGAFDESDAAFVMAIAQQGVAALENALAHDALQKADQERAEFVRIVTHELRSPVSGAQSLLRAMTRGLAGGLTDRQRDILRRLERRLDELLALINDLLALAASQTTSLHETLQPLPLQSILQRVIDQWAEQAAEKQVGIEAEMPDRELIVSATEEGLARIFDNLIGNAVKYTPQGGSVTIQVAEQPGRVMIIVADTGIGIPADDMPKLWSEFFRARNARESQIIGTGLGLNIVRRLVERYKGVIGVQSVEGQGTTFTVALPLAPTGNE